MGDEVIKVFVGCAPNGEDAEFMMVLEYSIKKYCSMPVEIVWMMISDDPNSFWYGWNSSQWVTPFSALDVVYLNIVIFKVKLFIWTAM